MIDRQQRRFAHVGAAAAAVVLGGAAAAAWNHAEIASAVASRPFVALGLLLMSAVSVTNLVVGVTEDDEERSFTLDEVGAAFALVLLGPVAGAALFVAATTLTSAYDVVRAGRLRATDDRSPLRTRLTKWCVNAAGYVLGGVAAAGVFALTAPAGAGPARTFLGGVTSGVTFSAVSMLVVAGAVSYFVGTPLRDAVRPMARWALGWGVGMSLTGAVLAMFAGGSAALVVIATLLMCAIIWGIARMARIALGYRSLNVIIDSSASNAMDGNREIEALPEPVSAAARALLRCDVVQVRESAPETTAGEIGAPLLGGDRTRLWLIAGKRRGTTPFGAHETDQIQGIARMIAASAHAGELGRVNEELEQATRLKDEFLSMLSHELRTPLAAITGYTDVLVKRWDRTSDETRLKYINVIGRQSKRQTHLVESLLKVSSYLAGHIDVEPQIVTVGDAARQASETSAVDVSVKGDVDAKALFDPDHLEQVLTNLMNNVKKYGAPPVEIRAAATGATVELYVSDSGPGVPDHLVETLFERFTQGDQRKGRQGVGLGLAIVRDLCVANGGEIEYVDDGTPGATFRLALPAATGAQKAEPAERDSA